MVDKLIHFYGMIEYCFTYNSIIMIFVKEVDTSARVELSRKDHALQTPERI